PPYLRLVVPSACWNAPKMVSSCCSGGPSLDIRFIHTRRTPPGTSRAPGRITAADLREPTARLDPVSPVYVCGPTGFVETVGELLVELFAGQGKEPATIRTERFG
ncbi:oxidoreductase, partial [Streptomyces olivaceoviridis]